MDMCNFVFIFFIEKVGKFRQPAKIIIFVCISDHNYDDRNDILGWFLFCFIECIQFKKPESYGEKSGKNHSSLN